MLTLARGSSGTTRQTGGSGSTTGTYYVAMKNSSKISLKRGHKCVLEKISDLLSGNGRMHAGSTTATDLKVRPFVHGTVPLCFVMDYQLI